MRNLTLTGALRGSKKEVNDWEKQWDADEDDDSDEEEEDETSAGVVATTLDVPSTSSGGITAGPSRDGSSTGIAAAATTPLHHHQSQVRPAMDVGHSELPMQAMPHSASVASTNIGTVPVSMESKPAMTNFKGSINKVSFVTPDAAPTQHHHDLAAEWDMAGIQPPSATVADQETMTVTQPLQDTTKPNVQMFLPMLRVLGKGSFGKVGTFSLRLCPMIICWLNCISFSFSTCTNHRWSWSKNELGRNEVDFSL